MSKSELQRCSVSRRKSGRTNLMLPLLGVFDWTYLAKEEPTTLSLAYTGAISDESRFSAKVASVVKILSDTAQLWSSGHSQEAGVTWMTAALHRNEESLYRGVPERFRFRMNVALRSTMTMCGVSADLLEMDPRLHGDAGMTQVLREWLRAFESLAACNPILYNDGGAWISAQWQAAFDRAHKRDESLTRVKRGAHQVDGAGAISSHKGLVEWAFTDAHVFPISRLSEKQLENSFSFGLALLYSTTVRDLSQLYQGEIKSIEEIKARLRIAFARAEYLSAFGLSAVVIQQLGGLPAFLSGFDMVVTNRSEGEGERWGDEILNDLNAVQRIDKLTIDLLNGYREHEDVIAQKIPERISKARSIVQKTREAFGLSEAQLEAEMKSDGPEEELFIQYIKAHRMPIGEAWSGLEILHPSHQYYHMARNYFDFLGDPHQYNESLIASGQQLD